MLRSSDVSSAKAKITWTASTATALDHYELRAVPGPEYNADDEVAVASIDPDAPREVLTDLFLGTPGAVVSYKLYVVLSTGNEAGSEAVVATRPA